MIAGYVPSQADLRELAVNVEDHEATGTVHLAAFLPYVENAISEYKWVEPPAFSGTCLGSAMYLYAKSAPTILPYNRGIRIPPV